MRSSKFWAVAVLSTVLSVILFGAGCSVNVKKEANGQDKQVDINTFAGGIHVSKQADVEDTGLNVYPGARLREKGSDGSDKSANVNISGFGFGLKVVALEYESDDAPAKVLSFYKDQLRKYGKVLECHTAGHFNVDMNMGRSSGKDSGNGSDNDSSDLTCGVNHGDNIELKVGKKYDQHIVEVEPEGKGSNFSLVYVRTHGKDAEI
jgi:hypothetical protein